MDLTRRAFIEFAAFLAAKIGVSESETGVDCYDGEWTSRSDDSDGWQEAVVTDCRIEVYWVSDDMRALYWAGTFDPVGDGVKTSENDKASTSAALMASGADTKDFTCIDGIISYEVTAMGAATTLSLSRK